MFGDLVKIQTFLLYFPKNVRITRIWKGVSIKSYSMRTFHVTPPGHERLKCGKQSYLLPGGKKNKRSYLFNRGLMESYGLSHVIYLHMTWKLSAASIKEQHIFLQACWQPLWEGDFWHPCAYWMAHLRITNLRILLERGMTFKAV